MALATIDKLLKENESILLRERRSSDRKPFMRPVTVTSGKNGDVVHEAFSRDISLGGIGVISRVEWMENTRATLSIQTLTLRENVCVAAIVCWSKPFGEGWFLTGWRFL